MAPRVVKVLVRTVTLTALAVALLGSPAGAEPSAGGSAPGLAEAASCPLLPPNEICPSAELEPDANSWRPSISGDGRYVAFQSRASNLVSGDTNGSTDVFVYDRGGDATERVSVTSGGVEASFYSADPSISADGRYVAFYAYDGLVLGDTNAATDIFVRDRTTGLTSRVSVDSAGGQANGQSLAPAISPDGRYVAFNSSASNLVSGDTNAASDVFVRDRSTGATTRVSVASGGGQAGGPSDSPSISSDGRYVAFHSAASNLVAGDTNAATDVFVRDRSMGTTTRVSVESTGAQGGGASSAPSISGDGRYVAFESLASFVGGLDANGTSDVYVRDRAAAATNMLSLGGLSDGRSYSPSIAADGSFVAFASDQPLFANDTNGVRDIYESSTGGTLKARLSVDDVLGQGNGASDLPSTSADGNLVAFGSDATNFAPDTNRSEDVYLHTWLPGPAVPPLAGRLDTTAPGDPPSASCTGESPAGPAPASTGPTSAGAAGAREGGQCRIERISKRLTQQALEELLEAIFEELLKGLEDGTFELPIFLDWPDAEPSRLYRGGSSGAMNFTPREPQDTGDWPNNGLSVWDSRLAACVHTTTRKVQELDRSRLEAIAGLLVQPDGDDSYRHHHFLVGNPESLHLEWARSRPTAEESPHRLTEAALGTIIERNVSCPRAGK